MADIYCDVSAAVTVPVNLLPLIARADGFTILAAETYNEAGLELIWNFVTSAGVQTHVAVTPTDTGGDYDWVAIGHGMYNIELPATGGASANNNAVGYGWFTGTATDAIPWRGPVICFRAAALNDALCDGGDLLDVNQAQYLGTACHAASEAGTGCVEVVRWGGSDIAATGINGTPKVDVAGYNGTAAHAADTAGIIPVGVHQWAGTDVHTPATAGIPEVNVHGVANDAITAAAIAAGAIDNATFAADVGSTAYATNIIALAADKAVVNATLATAAELAKVPKSDGTVTFNATALASVQASANAALVANNLDHLCLTATAGVDMTTEVADGTVLSRIISSSDTSAFVPASHSLAVVGADIAATHVHAAAADTQTVAAAIRADVGLASANLDTQLANLPTDADVNAACDTAVSDAALATAANLATVDTVVDGIVTTLGAAGAGLTALGTAAELAKVPKSDSNVTWNATALASINAEVDGALNTAIPGSPTADSVNERVATMDAKIAYLPSEAPSSVADIASAVVAKSELTVPAATVAKLDAMLEADGGVSRYTANALEQAPSGTGASAASIRAEIDANSTQLAAIVADTNELQAEWADGGRLDLILDAASAPSAATIVAAFLDHAGLSAHATADTPGAALNDIANVHTHAAAADTQTTATAIRTAVGLASANLDTQLAALPTDADVNAQADQAIADAALATATALAAVHTHAESADTQTAAAALRTAVGLATANLDTQLSAANNGTPPTVAAIRAEIDSNSTRLSAIDGKTTNLPSDPADESLIIAATDAIMTRIGAAGAGLTALGDSRLANLDAAVTTRLAGTSYTAPPSAATIADAVLDEPITEPTGMFAWAGASLRTIVGILGAFSRNKQTLNKTTGVAQLRTDADTGNISTRTDGDDGTTYTRGEGA